MRSVYESASRILVWLGPPSDNSVAGFELMEEIATRMFRVDDAGTHVYQEVELPLDAVAGILDLMRWYRLWSFRILLLLLKTHSLAVELNGCHGRWSVGH